MAEIEVEREDPRTFVVRVREAGGASTHRVSATPEQLARYGGAEDPEALLVASFRFLLEREPKESILRSFELPVIERYFPEYRAAMRAR